MDADTLDADTCCVAEVMATDIITLPADTAVASARRVVKESGAEQALVMDEGTLAGIVCRSDLQRAALDAPVATCMSSPVICVPPDTSLRDAADIMDANDLECLPVVTGAFLVVIVTRHDLLRIGVEGSAEAQDVCELCGRADDVTETDAGTFTATVPMALCAPCRGSLSRSSSADDQRPD
jgi:CBS domain-containing protein